MSNVEMQLISRIVYSGEIHRVLEWGITTSDFRTGEAKGLFEHICTYYSDAQTRGTTIGPALFSQHFSQVQLSADSGVTTDALCHEVRKSRIIGEAKEFSVQLADNVEIDVDGALSLMHSHVQKLLALGSTRNTDMSFAQAMTRMIHRYSQALAGNLPAKLQWPWEIMNDATGGIQEDDYIVLFGRPKSMKTWVLASIIANAYHQGKTALIYTKEMTQDNIFLRTAACVAELPYQELRNAKLTPEEEQLLQKLHGMVNNPNIAGNLICVSGQECAPGQDTVSWLQAKVEKYKPDVIFIDGMYLLSDEGGGKKSADWQRVTNISRAIRAMVLATKVPAICTMQANRGAAKHSNANLDEIAYADAIAQDATVAMRTINDKHQPTISLVTAGSREFKLHGFRINGVPATNFRYHSIMTEKDIRKAEENDTPDEADDATAHATPRVKRTPVTTNGATKNAMDAVTDKLVAQQMKNIG